jgi:hypothetical protein
MKNRDNFPWEAIGAIGEVLEANGHKHGMHGNWRSISLKENLVHAQEHISDALAGDTREPHLEHALTRLAFAVAISRGEVK